MKKIGLIGAGKMGLLQAALLNSDTKFCLAAVVEKTGLIVKAFKSVLPELKVYQDYKLMIKDTGIDIALITTPTMSHYTIARDLISNNISFFIEKPLCFSGTEATGLHNLLQTKKIKAFVGYCLMYEQSFLYAKQLLEENALGKIKNVSAEICSSDVLKEETGWRFKKSLSGGGVTIDLSVHILHLLVTYFGKPNNVNAEIKSIYSKEVEDEMYCSLRFQSGIVCNVFSTWSNPKYRKSTAMITIIGEKGTIVATDFSFELYKNDKLVKKLLRPDLYQGVNINIAGAHFSKQMENFAKYIYEPKFELNNFSAAVLVQKIVDAIYLSSEIKKSCEINI